MFICDTCGNRFDHPDSSRYDEAGLKEYYCPACKSQSFSNAYRCELCGEWTTDIDGDICNSCKNIIASTYLDGLIRELQSTYKITDRRKIINAVLDILEEM